MRLTTGEVCEIVDLPPHHLYKWCEEGFITPVEGAGGAGNHRKYTVMQTIGLAVGVALLKSERGCVPSYVGQVVTAFGDMKEAELVKRIAMGDVRFVGVEKGKPVLGGFQYPEAIDVEAIFFAVKKQIRQMEETGNRKKRGGCGRRGPRLAATPR